MSPQAVRKARLWGKVEVTDDGWIDVFESLAGWRRGTNPLLQRPSGTPRPWLDPQRRLTPTMIATLVERCHAEGAHVVDDEAVDPQESKGTER